MYISKLIISNFRAFDKIVLNFNKGVNILVGENNSGKTAIIDALRVCLGYGKNDAGIYIQESDLHINPNNPSEKNVEIRFDLIFEIENVIERRCFYDFISQNPEDSTKQNIHFHLKFTLEHSGKKKYFKRTAWGGDNEGQTIPYEALQEIFYTYLSPLRDAVSGLRPYSFDNKTSQLFNQLTKYQKGEENVPLNDNKKNELAKILYSLFESEEHDWKHILSTGNNKVIDHLEGTGINNKHPNIEMSYVGRKYSDVVRGIELKRPVFDTEHLGIHEQKYFEIHQNGLGENNLIFASVVLGDLINRCVDDELEIYNALLVEEPEAHLHPQYQNTFFEYLNTLQDKGLQIFITSHSPTITAKSKLDNITVLQRQKSVIRAFTFNQLTEKDFSEKNKKHLLKFLDTSKAQMLFANGAVLVEGIAEAILLPLLSRKFLGIDIEKNGIEIVNIGGVAFEHFAKLYNNDDADKRLLSKCAIITDSDPKGDKPVSDRASKAKCLAKFSLNSEYHRLILCHQKPTDRLSSFCHKPHPLTLFRSLNNLHISLANNTLEHDLFETSDRNKQIIRGVYREMHSDTPDLEGDFSADTLMTKLKSNKDKAEFALQLYDKLLLVDKFDVPNYIKEAIEFVVPKN